MAGNLQTDGEAQIVDGYAPPEGLAWASRSTSNWPSQSPSNGLSPARLDGSVRDF